MKIILVTWEGYNKTAYPYEKQTFDKINETFDSIVDYEIIEFLGSIYQPQDQLQKLPFDNGDDLQQLNTKLHDFLNDNSLKIVLPLMSKYQSVFELKGGEK